MLPSFFEIDCNESLTYRLARPSVYAYFNLETYVAAAVCFIGALI